MPSPVSFLVTTAPLPANTEFTPEQLNQAIAERLVVTPAEPWNSFKVGGTTPTSDGGPWLTAKEWKVWDSGTGAYVPLITDGAALKAASVPITALAPLAAEGNLLVSDDDKAVSELTSVGSVDGQVLTIVTVGGKKRPVWANTFVAGLYYFDSTLAPATPQTVEADGSVNKVKYDPTIAISGYVFDGTNNKLLVFPNEVWHFEASVQFKNNHGAVTDLSVELRVRVNGSNTVGIGKVKRFADAVDSDSIDVSGIIALPADAAYVDVSLTVNGTPASAGDDIQIEPNATNTRFGGYRII